MTDQPVMLIAGGTGSVGSAVAREAARLGWALVVHGGTRAKVDALIAELRETTPAQGIAVDVHEAGAAENLVAQAAAAFGQIDAVVDCIATGPGGARLTGLFKDTDPQRYGAFYDLSAAWFQRLAHAAYPLLAERGGTLIAFISDAGKFAAPRQTVIGAARAATIGFVRNLSVEAARDQIRVHAISPSYVAGSAVAERMGAERMATAEQRAGLGLPSADDIAPITVFLCGAGAAKITGQVISVNGGLNA
jgi:NAD(P)-dependent dehydrogenase (short-subunit alcohol dehydrogenase family)